MTTPIRPPEDKRRSHVVRVVSLIVTMLVIALYILVLTRGHVPSHLPILTR
jgi:hypothetical protein